MTLDTRCARTSPARRLRSIIGGSIGNLVEWYDWFSYSAFALYFAKAFFPTGDRTDQLLNAAAVFAVGFLARPIGGWLIGLYADRAGRRAALILSMLVMGLGSLIIGLTPAYERIGSFAPALLVLARVVQGLSIGGEYASSATYLSEVAGKKSRGFWTSFLYVTMIMGQLLAMGVLLVLQQLLTQEALNDWGWRVPFVIGAALAILALWVMLGIEETDSFKAIQRRAEPVRTWKVLAQHPRELATVFGLTTGGALGFYIYTTYAQKFLVNTSGFPVDRATQITTAALVVFMFLQPAAGWLSDQVGRRPLMIAFSALSVVFTVPLMTSLAATHDAATAFLLVMAGLAILSLYTAISGLYKAELFPAEIRALGVGLPYAIALSTFGGTAEFIALWFKQSGHEGRFYWYVTVCMGISLISATLMRDTQRHSRILED